MTVDTNAQLLAEGRNITLTDGSEVHIRFDLNTFCQIEKRWGSIGAVAQTIAALYGPDNVTRVRDLIAFFAGREPEEIGNLLDPLKISDYVEALDAAMAEALPAPSKGGPGKASDNGSTGPSSSTPEPSSTASASPSSGP